MRIHSTLRLNNYMSNLSINTSQNVQINYKLASIGDRIMAFLIDWIIIISYALLFIFLLSSFFSTNLDSLDESFIDQNTSGIIFYLVFFFILFSPVIFYHLLCEQFMQGQSFGKRAMKIKVVMADSGQPGFGNYFIRWILRIIDSFPYWGVGICSILFSKKSQRLGDLAAGTIVIKLGEQITSSDTVFFEYDENHIVKYHNVLRLKDSEIEIIKTIMNKAETENKPEILHTLVDKIRTVIGAEAVDELATVPFLNQVLKDYNYLCIAGQ